MTNGTLVNTLASSDTGVELEIFLNVLSIALVIGLSRVTLPLLIASISEADVTIPMNLVPSALRTGKEET
jgi:ABC-type spermidine/putrescine transport system permease subunit I